jgi:hypothetical protein
MMKRKSNFIAQPNADLRAFTWAISADPANVVGSPVEPCREGTLERYRAERTRLRARYGSSAFTTAGDNREQYPE